MRGAGWGALLALLAGARALLPLEAERLRASVGGFAVMNCHLDFPFGNEIPYHLQWEKDGEVIFSWYSGDAEPLVADRWGGRVRRVGGEGGAGGAGGLGRGSVNVSAVRETDAGLYRCRVAFPNRSPPSRNNGTFYYLDVEGGNLIVTPPTNVTVLEGERAELECLPKSAQWPVQWYREGAPLEALPELAARAERARNGSLLLRAAASADLGYYECRVAADDGQLQSAGAYLDVQYKAKVIYSPKERYLPYGKAASLDCHFSANPPLTNLRWEKDGFLFDPYNVPGVFYSRNGSLLFNRVDESHEGLYSCTPYNELGSAGGSGAVRVRVTRPPALAARPPPLLLARLGASLALPCAPHADPRGPAPTVRWTRKDGSALPEGRHALVGGNLTISAVQETDGGVYVCTVANDADAVAAESELLIENVPPRAPHNLTALPARDAIHLSWTSGHSGLEVEHTVWYREQAVSEWRTMKILSRGVTHATLLGLRPATRYELRVLAQDHIGDGLFSKPLFVRTLDPELGESEGATAFAAATTEESGTGDPSDDDDPSELEVTVRLLEEGALVRWRGPAGGGDGDGSRCSVRWYRDGSPAPHLLATTHTSHDYILVGEVEEGASYWVRVQCAWGAGVAVVHVPQYARLRGVAIGAAVGALLLAALAAALLLARRRLRPRLLPDKRTR